MEHDTTKPNLRKTYNTKFKKLETNGNTTSHNKEKP
jgi:hypothetical protein